MKSSCVCQISLSVLWLAGASAVGAAEIDQSKLPPPATKKVEFSSDIKPILENNCLRCHGPERPKSNFRLTDRASALKGGANGVDIVPGNSGQSPLIHYVSRLVADMEMPPEGKGEPLSPEQVGLLRAWIDQDVVWDQSASSASALALSLSPELRWTAVQGDRTQFRDLEWQPEGWNGGVEQFEFSRKWADGRSASAEGHALLDDYKFGLELRKPDLGYGRFYFDQYRKYYNDAGGYYQGFSPPLFRLDQDLHLDIGRAGVEFGLMLPDWPRITVGYEYQYKQGMKSMLTWGPVQSPSGNFLDIRNVYPSAEDIDEHTHVVWLNIAHAIRGFEFENGLRAEFYRAETLRTDALDVQPGGSKPDLLTRVAEGHQYTQIADTVRLQKQIADWWLAGVGYRYSWLDGDATFGLRPQDAAGQPAAGSAWSADKIVLNESWQLANANSQFRILPQLNATLGAQGEWKRQDTFGDVNLDEVVDPTDPTSGIFRYPATEESTLDQTTAEENVLVRYTGLPFTSVFGEALLKQEDYSRTTDQDNGPHAVQFASDAQTRWSDFRLGFSSSPARRVSFGGHYRHRDRKTDYQYPLAIRDGVYPGFILARDIVSDELEGRVTIQAASWLKTTLTYDWTDSDFHTTTAATSPADVGSDATPGGSVLAGRYQAHTASANATLTPFRQLYFTGTISYQNSRTTTANNDSPSVSPYAGDLWSVLANATYVVDNLTEVFLGYAFSQARFAQHNETGGLPLGIDYDRHGLQAGVVRRLSKAVNARLQYSYFTYDEPSSGHLRDYTAHQVLAVVGLRW